MAVDKENPEIVNLLLTNKKINVNIPYIFNYILLIKFKKKLISNRIFNSKQLIKFYSKSYKISHQKIFYLVK